MINNNRYFSDDVIIGKHPCDIEAEPSQLSTRTESKMSVNYDTDTQSIYGFELTMLNRTNSIVSRSGNDANQHKYACFAINCCRMQVQNRIGHGQEGTIKTVDVGTIFEVNPKRQQLQRTGARKALRREWRSRER